MTEMSSDYVPFAGPSFDTREIDAITAVLHRGWVSTGQEAAEFEREMAELADRRYAVALNSCTAALHLAYLAVGAGPGDEVIVPTVTFTATAAAVVHAGATPVLVDVDPVDLNIAPAAVEAALTSRTKAVVAVHFAGRIADLAPLRALTLARGIALIEDAAHTLPAFRAGRPAGSVGDAAAFSFFATKPITSGDGGMLVTDSAEIEERARILSLHGISREAAGRYAPGGSAHYEVFHAGFKYNMTDLAAAVGRAQLAKHQDFWRARRDVARRYDAGLADLDAIEPPRGDTPEDQSSWYLYVIRLNTERLSIDRDQFCAELHELGVGTSIHFRPLHTYKYYREHVVSAGAAFPVADAAFPRIVSLPMHTALTERDTERVVESVRALSRKYAR